MDTIADKLVYQVIFSNLLLFRNLSILLDIFNLVPIGLDVALLLMSDLLHVLLHAILLRLGVLIALVL